MGFGTNMINQIKACTIQMLRSIFKAEMAEGMILGVVGRAMLDFRSPNSLVLGQFLFKIS